MRRILGNTRVLSKSTQAADKSDRAGVGASTKYRRRQLMCLSVAVAGVLAAGSKSRAADTALNVPLSTTDLATTSPTITNDLTFTNSSYLSPNAFTVSTNISTGTLDDLDTLQALTVNNTGGGAIALSTLNNSTGGTVPADLLYIAPLANLTFNAPLALGVAGGNFDIGRHRRIGGIISSGASAFGFTKTGAGTLTLNGSAPNTYTGATAVNRGTLSLDFSNLGSTPNLISSSSALQMGGGTLNVIGNSAGSSQTFASTALLAGGNTIAVGQTNVNNPALALSAITQSPGSAVTFVGPATINTAGTVAGTGTITTTTAGAGTLGELGNFGVGKNGAYATVGLYDWASTDTTAGAAGSSPYTIVGGSQVSGFYQTTGLTTGGNYDVSASGVNTLGNAGGAQTVRFNNPAATTITFSATTAQNIQGFLITPNMGATNAFLKGSASGYGIEFVRSTAGGASYGDIWQNNTLAFLDVNCSINGGRQAGQTNGLVQAGPGTVVYAPTSNSNPYELGTFLDGGFSVVNVDAELGVAATAATVTLGGGTVVGDATFTMDNAGANPRPFALAAPGGGVAAITGFTMTIDGPVSGANGTGPLVIGIPASSANSNTVGLLPGTGAGTANTTANYATGTVVLSNTTNSFTGGVILDSGILQLTNTNLNVLGTGGITLNGGTFQWGTSNTTDISTRLINLASTGTFDTQSNTVTFTNAIGNGATGGFTKAGSGTLTLNGANTFTGGVNVNAGNLVFGNANVYTGSTAVNGGTLTLNSTAASLGNTAITVASGTTFAAKPGATGGNIAVGTTGASLTLNSGANFSLADGNIDTLTINNVGSSTVTPVLSLNGANLSFNVGATGASELIANNGTFANSGINNISVASIGSSAPSSLNQIPLLSVPNAGGNLVLSDFSLQTTAASFGSSSYIASLSTNAADTILYLNLTAASLSYYFAGSSNSSFSNPNNFVNGPTSTTNETGAPQAANNVFLTADTGTANAVNSANITLDGSYTVNSLTLTGTGTVTPVTLSPGSGGTLTLQAANSFSDSNTSNSYGVGTGLVVESGAGADTISASINLASSQTWEIDNSVTSPLTVSGNIGGSAYSLTKTGSGKLILSGSNSYGAGTAVSAGILQLGASASNALPANAPLTVSGGTLDLNGNTATVSSLSDAGLSSGTVTDSLGGATLNVNNAASTTFSGSLSGGLAFNYSGSATLTLSGVSNTYTGMTTVNNGTLVGSSNQPFGSITSASGGLTLNNSATVDLTGTAPAIASLSGNSATTNIILGGAAVPGGSPTVLTVNTSSSNPSTYNGTISDVSALYASGLGGLSTTGNGSLTLNGTNTFFGTTTIGGTSTVVLGNSVALENSTLNYNNPTGTLSFGTQTAATLGGLSGNQPLALLNTAAAAVTLTIGGNNANTTYAGALNGSGGALVKNGSGITTLSGMNSYSGPTNVNAGNLTLTSTGAIGATLTPATAGAVTFGDNGNGTISGTINASSFTTNSNGASTVTISGGQTSVSGVLYVNNDGGNAAGVLVITGGNVSAGTINVSRSTLNFGTTIQTAGSTTEGIYVNGGALSSAGALNMGTSSKANSSVNVRLDSGSINVSGTTYITDNGSPRYSLLDVAGGTFNSGGGVVIGGSFATSYGEFLVRGGVASVSGITTGDAAQSAGANTIELLGGTLYIDAGGIVESAAAAFPVTPTINFGGTTYATAPIVAATAPWSSALNMTLTNSSSGVAPMLQASNATGGALSITLTGNLNGSGGLNVIGTGIVTLAPSTGTNNSYTGLTNVSSGKLVLGNSAAFPTGTPLSISTGALAVDEANSVLAAATSINMNGNMIIQGGASLAAVTAEVKAGFNGGAWNGSGTSIIGSSAAAADASHLHTLGVIQNDNGTGSPLYSSSTKLFEGFDETDGGTNSNPDADILVKYTYYGDANLDGKVDASDYSRIDNGFINQLTGWFNGDFNYDGVVNGSDYTLIDNAYNTQGAAIADQLATATAEIAGTSAVPEPTTLGLLAIGTAGLLGRRRRRI